MAGKKNFDWLRYTRLRLKKATGRVAALGFGGTGAASLSQIVPWFKVESEGTAFLILDGGVGGTAGNQLANIDFYLDSVQVGNVSASEATTDNPLEINSAVTNDVSVVVGGGDFGVGSNAPQARLYVIKTISDTTALAILENSSTGDVTLRWTLTGAASYAVGIDNSDGDKWQVAYNAGNAAALGTAPQLTILGSASAPQYIFGLSSSPTSMIDVVSNDSTFPTGRQLFFGLYTNTAFPYGMAFAKSRHATIGSHTVVQDGDVLARWVGQGSDGDQFHAAARLDIIVDGTPGDNDMPGRMVILTTPAGSTTPAERFKVKSDGNLIVGTGTTSPSGGGTPLLLFPDLGATPTGMPSNHCGIYGDDYSGTVELTGIGEDGTATRLTPHAQDGPPEMYWNKGLLPDLVLADSNESFIGARRWTNVTLLAAFCEWAAAELAALGRAVPREFGQFMFEDKTAEPALDWDAHQAWLAQQRQAEIARWEKQVADTEAARVVEMARWETLPPVEKARRPRPQPVTDAERAEFGPRPQPLAAKPMPAWMAAARERGDNIPPTRAGAGRQNKP